MSNKNLHEELKTALMLLDSSISEFAQQLNKPDGGTGVSHTAVIRVAQGHEHIEWIEKEIDRQINRAYRLFPEYYNHREEKAKKPA